MRGSLPRAGLLLAMLAGAAGCRAPDPQAEVAVDGLETYWAVDPTVGNTQYIAPVARFHLRNKGGKQLDSIQASATFRRKGEAETWSGAFQQVAPIARKPLAPGQSALVVLKPDGEGRYHSTVSPEEMLAHQQFKDVWVEVFLRVGPSGWTKMAQADVERRIGSHAAQAEEGR